MKIRRLDIQGFKSFADRTSLDFGPGISAIVGPNGCGKSNVVDAIKWVLGDMSPSSLRGKRMEDVIFAGARSRKASALAEVTLALDNQDGLLKSEHTEVSITRRLNRAGESDYLINGQAARLKDIRELFLDTGLGIEGNAIMEQGRIDALLTANSQDRRGIFEEAAGVSRYKQRRKESEQRLQRTSENLERLRDVLELEEKRWRSLKVQASRARRYQELRDELAKSRLLRAVTKYRAVATERDQVQERMRAILQEEEQAAAALATLESEGRQAGTEREAAREEVLALETKIAHAASEVRAAEDRVGFAGRTAEDLRARAAAARRQAEDARHRAAGLATETADLEASVTAAQEEAGRCAAEVGRAEADLAALEADAARIRDAHDGAKREALAALGRIAEHKNLETERRAEIRQAEDRLARLAQRRADLSAQGARIDQEADGLVDEAARLETAAREASQALGAAEHARADALRASDEAARRRAALAEERATKTARLEVLERLAAAREGVEDGARAVLSELEKVPAEADGSRRGVLGLLADLVLAEGAGAPALDRLLGHAAGAVVVRSRAEALGWVEWLRGRGKHERARFLCLDLVRREAPALPAEVGALTCREDLARLVASVVAGTELVADLETGIRAWAERGVNAVTPGGERVTSSGALLAGRDGPALGLVERTAEVRYLRLERVRLTEACETAQGEVARAQDEVRTAEEAIRSLRRRLASHAEDQSRGVEALARVEQAAREIDSHVSLLDGERLEFDGLLAAARAAAAEVAAKREVLEGERAALEEKADEAGRGYLAVEAAKNAALERRMELRLAHAEARARAEGATERRERARKEREELEQRAATEDAEAADMDHRIGEADVEAAEAAARARASESEKQSAGDLLLQARARQDTLESTVGAHEARRRELAHLHDEVKERLDAHRLQDSEYRVRIETLLDQVRQDQGLDLAQAAADPSANVAPEGVDLDAMLDDLRRRIEELGNVNLNAIGELDEAEQRVTFLKKEENDLLEAKNGLETAITELDALSTTRFAETFELVREHFRETFRRLFGGGRAEIVLEDAANPLESGVDIIARPPGKEQRTISLLSGGERTLTAVALLFAVFKAKPSPFAILDEVDAALDEANVRRLVALVREFTDRSQFLVVTHAKTTMEAADVLYGITMEEPGISKKVAVRLTEFPAESSVAAG